MNSLRKRILIVTTDISNKNAVKLNSFPKEIHGNLGAYVYKLIDPRNGAVFYIGKGKGDRVFAHTNGILINDTAKEEYEDDESLKVKTIRDIYNSGLAPINIIVRHGMTDDEAFLAEAVLIDSTPGLTNRSGGHGSNDKGPTSTNQLIERYKAKIMDIDKNHKIIAINVRISSEEKDLYRAVRHSWKLKKENAEKADFIFAIIDGICKEVFTCEKWLDATVDNFDDLDHDIPGRIGFEGNEAPKEISEKYKGKRLPDQFTRKKGASNPIQYLF